jgi:hypothetical protein
VEFWLIGIGAASASSTMRAPATTLAWRRRPRPIDAMPMAVSVASPSVTIIAYRAGTRRPSNPGTKL